MRRATTKTVFFSHQKLTKQIIFRKTVTKKNFRNEKYENCENVIDISSFCRNVYEVTKYNSVNHAGNHTAGDFEGVLAHSAFFSRASPGKNRIRAEQSTITNYQPPKTDLRAIQLSRYLRNFTV